MDSDSALISGLVPRAMTFNITSNPSMIVGSKVGLRFDITLPDTINQNDIFRFYLPTVLEYSAPYFVSTLALGFSLTTPPVFDSSTQMLEIKQRTQAQVNSANKSITIVISTFTAPPSTKTFGVTLQILRNNFLMSQDIAYSNAIIRTYTGTVSSTDLNINHFQSTSYSITLDVKNVHLNLMMI